MPEYKVWDETAWSDRGQYLEEGATEDAEELHTVVEASSASAAAKKRTQNDLMEQDFEDSIYVVESEDGARETFKVTVRVITEINVMRTREQL